MPLYSYKCPMCGRTEQLFLTPELSKLEQKCKVDRTALQRTPRMASAIVKEVVDTGAMGKAVEYIKK